MALAPRSCPQGPALVQLGGGGASRPPCEGGGFALGWERQEPQRCPAAMVGRERSGAAAGQQSWAGGWTHGRAEVPPGAAQGWALGRVDGGDLLVTHLCRLLEEPLLAAALCPAPCPAVASGVEAQQCVDCASRAA